MQTGYFDQAAELKPLLHTWSLAVEEQFYVLFPLLLVFLYKYSWRAILTAFVLLFLGSLFLAQAGGNFELRHSLHYGSWSWNSQPSWGFYFLVSRAWELLLGAIISSYQFYAGPSQRPRGRVVSEFGSLIGLGLIAFAIYSFDHTTPIPSIYALIPTLGGALVIFLRAKAQLCTGYCRFVSWLA